MIMNDLKLIINVFNKNVIMYGCFYIFMFSIWNFDDIVNIIIIYVIIVVVCFLIILFNMLIIMVVVKK